MAETKYTPGPWRIGENQDNLSVQPWTDAIPIEAPEDEGGLLATPTIVAWTTRGGPARRNADLLAAAPDQDAALNYVADMTYCGADAEWHFKPGYDPQIVLDAIAKARDGR